MTRIDLQKAYYLGKEIDMWKEEKNRLKTAYEKQKVSKRISELEKKRQEIRDFIMSIDDPQIRLIVQLRCLNNLTWNAVADRVGGMNSEYTVKKRFFRFLKKVGI